MLKLKQKEVNKMYKEGFVSKLKKARMEQQKKERREQEKARREEEARIAKEKEIQSIQENNVNGGYCGLSCRHCYEEFLDSRGSIVGDFDDGGIFEYYCNLGHSVSFGRFCEDYE